MKFMSLRRVYLFIFLFLCPLFPLCNSIADEKPTPVSVVSPSPVLWSCDFEDPQALQMWYPLNGQWGLVSDESVVVRQTQPAFRGQARLVHMPGNYEVSAIVRPINFSGSAWGMGLIAYWQPQGGCYRLSNYGNILALWRESADEVKVLAAAPWEIKPQAYRMRLAVEKEMQMTSLRAKVWAIGEKEPESWLLRAQDYDWPLRYGRAGVFTGRAAAAFSDFAVSLFSAASGRPDAAAPAAWPVGNYWHFVGGEWQSTATGLRQNVVGSTLGFRSASYAIAAGWSNYTVRVAVKADSGSQCQGFGLSAYWLEEEQQYQLGQLNFNRLVLLRKMPGAETRQLASQPYSFRKGIWYVLKLQLSNEKTGVRLQGKVWPAHMNEPGVWQISILDETQPRLLGGEIGLWCVDDVCSFDEVQVTAP